MEWLRDNGCACGTNTFDYITRYGTVENIKWLHANFVN